MGIWWEILFACVVFTHNYSALWLTFWYNIGDKELFWIAATISGDDWAFEPFLAGQYGDCAGFVLHFDPDDYDKDDVSVMFINAEYLVEHVGKTNYIGR